MTAISFGKTFDRVKAIDVRAGKLFGNADHIRAQQTSGFAYAMDLGMRIFILGLSVALLQCLLAFIWMLRVPELNHLSGLAYGFVLFLVSSSLYPNREVFTLPLCIDLAVSALVGMYTGMIGVSADIALQAALPIIASESIGILIALQIMAYLAKMIASAFKGEPVRRHPSMKRIAAAGLLSPQDILDLKNSWRLCLPFIAGIVILGVLMAAAAVVNSVGLGLISSIAFIACYFLMMFAAWKGAKIERAIVARLCEQGMIKPLIQESVVVTQVEYGYEFNGVAYPTKKRR